MQVLVTGAARGIGRATCLKLARDGAVRGQRIGIAAQDAAHRPELDALVAELNGLGARAVALDGDMGNVEAPARAVEQALTALGGLDGIVSNAGISRPSPLIEAKLEDWERVFAVNTRATWLLAKAAQPALAASKGSLVAVASMSGMYPHPGLSAYSPSKAAVIMLVKVLAQELAPHGIRANVVSPGMVRTMMTELVYQDPVLKAEREEQVPLRRVATPEDIAAGICFLLGPEASYVSGENLLIDGAFTGSLLGRIPGLAQLRS
ncbi:MAG: SDR family oxidoreductase [Alphaproteobacteria bacterium]|nr:SDR family oxidoreductase [Alphaproteobacteria bacterium]